MNNFALQQRGALKLAVSVSLLILLAGAWLVLRWWYPYPFWQASGVFSIAVYAVFVHLGITALLLLPWRNRSSNADETKADIGLLLFVMLGAALFSLSFLFAGRPVALVFAVDRVALVRANEVRTIELAFAGVLDKNLRLSGPLQLMAARPSSDEERLDSIRLAMAGFDLHQRPSFWGDIETQRDQVIQKSHLVAELGGSLAAQLVQSNDAQVNWPRYLPLAGVSGNWALLLDNDLTTYAPAEVE